MIFWFISFLFSKIKRRLEKKPPKRSTICTTPRFLMKEKGKAQKKHQTQKEETKLPTAAQRQKDIKKTNRREKKAPKGGGAKKHNDATRKMRSNSSGVKIKK